MIKVSFTSSVRLSQLLPLFRHAIQLHCYAVQVCCYAFCSCATPFGPSWRCDDSERKLILIQDGVGVVIVVYLCFPWNRGQCAIIYTVLSPIIGIELKMPSKSLLLDQHDALTLESALAEHTVHLQAESQSFSYNNNLESH